MPAKVVPFKLYPQTAAGFRAFCKQNALTADQALNFLLDTASNGSKIHTKGDA